MESSGFVLLADIQTTAHDTEKKGEKMGKKHTKDSHNQRYRKKRSITLRSCVTLLY